MTAIEPSRSDTHSNPASAAFDVAVVGAGPSGLMAALLVAGLGFETALIAPESRPDDTRTTALLGGSVKLLERMGLWEALAARGQPLEVMRLVDDTGRLIRAPEAVFRAPEIGIGTFGSNITNRDITEVLDARAAAEPKLTRILGAVTDVRTRETGIDLTLDDGRTIAAAVAVAADGRRSKLREAAGIEVSTWSYPQSALVLNMRHTAEHNDVSTEFHTRSGPFVLVPLPGKRTSIVLVEKPEVAERLNAMNDADLAIELERRSHSILGRIEIESERQLWPLSGMTAKRVAAKRVFLVGETAHVFPPIGAQGLNLSARDVAALGEVLARARREGRDLGSAGTMDAYERARRIDVETRTRGVDMADRLLLSDALPAQVVRSLGFWAINRFAPLRHLVMREGLMPSFAAPRMMRGLKVG